jgi:cysteine desulfurase
MGVAITLAESERESYVHEVSLLRDKLMAGIEQSIEGSELMGHPEHRLANNVHFAFDRVKGDELVAALDAHDIAASAGSACGTAVWEPSHVLLAMGLPLARAAGGLRLTLGAQNTIEDVDYVLSVLPRVVEGLRESTTASVRS